MTNQKSFVGVDNIYFSLVTQDDASAYAAGTPAYLAPAMTISQKPKTSAKTQYADNQPFDAMSSEGETSIDVEITGLQLGVLATLLGRVYDTATGRMFDNGGTPPDVAIGFRAKKRGGDYRYYWFLKGNFMSPTEDQSTETDSPDPKSTKLQFTAIRTIHQFALDGSITDSVKRVIGETSDANFSATNWWNAVQVPVYGAPSAITCTPSPVDGASSVATSATVTLTFNNALAAGSEDSIVLTADTGVLKACTRTINAAREVVTLTPTTALASLTTYLVIVPHAVDVYGQALASAVYDFTTA